MKNIIDIDNKYLPIGKVINELLLSLPENKRIEVQEKMTVDEFVRHRVDVYFETMEKGLQSGMLHPVGAEELARRECTLDLLLND